MFDEELNDKVTYFHQQHLLDRCDDQDERHFPGSGLLAAQRLLADLEAMPSPLPARRGSSFLGPTPRERLHEFEAHATRQRTAMRRSGTELKRSSTAPEAHTRSFPNVTSGPSDAEHHMELKQSASMSDFSRERATPFYRRLGEVPRELKNVNAKLALAIRIEPEHKQLLKEKIVYFYPNDDTSMARRLQIHKIVKLGAAWVTAWRDDVTHVIFEDGNATYAQLLRHLNRTKIPCTTAVVRFDPYIPQCIQHGALLDHTATRFAVEGAPCLRSHDDTPGLAESQTSLQIKPSIQRLATDSSLKNGANNAKSIPRWQKIMESSDTKHAVITENIHLAENSLMGTPAERGSGPGANDDSEIFQAIQETRAVAHLPLDDESEDTSWSMSLGKPDSDSGTDDEATRQQSAARTKSQNNRVTQNKRKPINQSTFQCMNPAAASSAASNPNARTIEILNQMCKYYDQMQDQWRTIAYRKAIATLRKQTVKITTSKEAAALPFVGSRLADKIEEIVLTDHLRRLDSTYADPTDKVLRLFLGIYGVGVMQANKWIQAGYRSLDDLLANAKLNDSQIIGIDHYDDFAALIPRNEVEEHGECVRDAFRNIDSAFQVTIMGSYRRGAEHSGDIDLIITKPGATLSTLRDVTFQIVVPQLFKTGFLKAKLATSSSTDDGSKWHGASCLPSSDIWRRLDLLLVPEEELGAAFIYFTGNDIFNRSIRLLASKKGMRLNQRGLYSSVRRGTNRVKLNEGTLVEGRCERRIFDILGVPWREPIDRIC